MAPRILIYGATGTMGRAIAAEAAHRGLETVVAGRSADGLKRVAAPLGLESRVVPLTDPVSLRSALEGIDCVVHAAGPFSATAAQMVEACLATATHYLDITGEIQVFEAIARRDAEARAAGIVLLPGAGFEVVPSDCLAAHLARRVEEPVSLRLAIAGVGGNASRGALRSGIGASGEGLCVRRGGILRRLPAGSVERSFDFGAGPVRGLAVARGDVATAFHSLGVPDVEVYSIVSGRAARSIRVSRWAAPLLRLGPVRRLLEARFAARLEAGPDEWTQERARAVLLAELEGADGECARARLETPFAPRFTVRSAVEIARRLGEALCQARDAGEQRGAAPSGYHTPSSAFGPDLVVELPGCRRVDLDAGADRA